MIFNYNVPIIYKIINIYLNLFDFLVYHLKIIHVII